jgi:crossover junction endodeoxyribonuclease RusA
MNSLTFVVYGLPAPQGSKRHLGKGVLVESSKAVAPWRQDVKHAALTCLPHDWDPSLPMALSVVFRFKRPAHHIGKKGLKPSAPEHCTSARKGDIDKLQRSLLDGLTGVAYDDDRQVVSVTAHKRYTVGEEPQGALITLMPLVPVPAQG